MQSPQSDLTLTQTFWAAEHGQNLIGYRWSKQFHHSNLKHTILRFRLRFEFQAENSNWLRIWPLTKKWTLIFHILPKVLTESINIWIFFRMKFLKVIKKCSWDFHDFEMTLKLDNFGIRRCEKLKLICIFDKY